MYQRNLLLLVVVAFAACASDVTYAKNAIRATDAVNGDTTHRNLKGNAAIVNAAAAVDEERGINFKMPGFLTRFFPKNSKISSAVQSSPEIAKAINDPKVGQAVKELGKKKGLLDHLRGLPGIRHIAKRMKGKPLTTNNVKEIGAVAVRSSGTRNGFLKNLWVNHGAYIFLAVGLLVVFGSVALSFALKK
ncbi:hypothetical protein ON010_g4456 [Phytophthora cinnamomi]|nr:hypothetical protein ON010_g4456 [Phytophthora cinnamomi]